MLFRSAVAFAISHLTLAGSAPGTSQTPGPGYQQVFEQLRSTTPRADQVAAVRDLVLRRDAIELRLDSGSLALLAPVGGRIIGAVFVGTGSVAFAPPLPVERQHLQQVLGDSVLDTPIQAAVLLFADSTREELLRHLSFGREPVPHDAAAAVSDALDRALDDGTRYVDPTFMAALLNGEANGYFHAHVKRPHGEDLIFEVDPFQQEPVALLRAGRHGGKLEIVSLFPRTDTAGDTLARSDTGLDPIAVPTTSIDATLDNGLGFSSVTTLHFKARRDGVRWARLLLFPDLTADSVLGADGSRDSVFRAKGSVSLWVRFGKALSIGQADSIRIFDHGNLIVFGSLLRRLVPSLMTSGAGQALPAADTWFFVRETETWFPRIATWEAGEFTLTFHTPKRYQFASIGRLVDSRVDGDVRTTHWVTERPTTQVCFNIGEFKEFQIKDPRFPPVTVQVNDEAHRRMGALLYEQRDPEKAVGSDVVHSLAFFTEVFGPPLFSSYFATEIPYPRGQAFPGLIYLSWYTFESSDERGANQIFRAHEIAHQWWGIGVEPAGYRDVWLSEGFANFAGLWYMQRILVDNKKFLDQLDKWREDIRVASSDAGPIALGTRVAVTRPRDYQVMIYEKGAWVVQMLRNLMMDFRTMNDDVFTATMQDFYQQYRGRSATTQDFQRVVERHMGSSMAWFFNQWVYGTGVPRYVFASKVEPTMDHQYLLRVRVRQEDVPNSFLMPVPLRIVFADSSQMVVRVNVQGNETTGALPLPAEPVRVEFNYLSSVLADVKTEGW